MFIASYNVYHNIIKEFCVTIDEDLFWCTGKIWKNTWIKHLKVITEVKSSYLEFSLIPMNKPR